MAETVKKSRIVSETDDDLEESLMEEFNMRLKKCMSQDDLQQTKDFIKAERENVYEETKQNGYHQSDKTDVIADQPYVEMTFNCPVYEDVDDRPDLSDDVAGVKSAKDRMLLSTNMDSCLLFTQTVTSPMLTPSDENIDFLKGFTNGDKEENVYENSEFLKRQHEENEDVIIYVNLKQDQEESIYENLKDLNLEEEKNDEAIYQNVGELRNEEEEVENSEIPSENSESVTKSDVDEVYEETKSVDILKQINKFECEESTQVTESYVETTVIEQSSDKGLKKKKSKKSRKEEKENISVKSSFSKFDALQKKNVLHVRSSDSSKAQEKFNGAQMDPSNCRSCGKQVFQMEQIKAEKAVWHKNCFRCTECNKQLNVDTYQSNEGTLYCKPHFKALFAPKAVEDDTPPSDKPDLGLEELQSLNVKERFQVFENYQSETTDERSLSNVNVKRSASILSKLAKFQAKGMDVGVTDDSLNGIPIEESSSETEEEEQEEGEGEDADLIRAKKVQREKPFHFTGMSDVKSKWEQGEQKTSRDERREERKQEIQSIRNRLFMGKQGKMKEAYQQAVMESESCVNLRKEPIEICDTKSLKEKFEKGELEKEVVKENKDSEESEVYESEISKRSRSLFLELDANASKAPQLTPVQTPKIDVKKARDNYLLKQATEDTVKSSPGNVVDDVQVRTAEIQQRFKFFETYKEPEKEKRTFRMTPPREGQVKGPTPDRDVYKDPEIVRADEEYVEDSVVAKESHTATKMLNKFRQMEENLTKEVQPAGPKPLKRFTPPPEPTRPESSSEAESGSEEEEEEDEPDNSSQLPDDLVEAQKAARAKQLRAKFERWEANEIRREQNSSTVNIIEELGDEQSQVESTRSLRARFESMRDNSAETNRQPRVKVNRFVELPGVTETCENCQKRVYPLEKISVHNLIYHKSCFKCMECHCVLRMDSYSYNQGLLYCIPHFKRLFISKGNYDTGFGLEQRKEKWNPTVA